MKFLKNLLSTNGKDQFGIDSAVDGVRKLQQRLASEQERLEAEKERLRDAALDDPSADFDETPVLRQRERIAALEAAIEKALADAAGQIQARMPALKEKVGALEQQRAELRRERDMAVLQVISAFIRATGARLVQPPRKGAGGVLHLPAVVMEKDEVENFFADLPAAGVPEATETTRKLDAVSDEIRRLETLCHFGTRTGLETLAGCGG